MAQPFKELFHLGVVTARDATLLNEGELVQADDCIYRPNDPGIWKAPGRTAYGTVQATAIASVGTTLNDPSLSKVGGFGTGVSSTTALGSPDIISTAGFTSAMVGLRVYGTGIQPNTYVLSFSTTSAITLSRNATAAGTVTLNFSPYSAGMFVTGTGVAANATILSVDGANLITLDTNGTATGTATVTISAPIKSVLFLAFDKGKPTAVLAYATSKLYSSAYTAATGTFTSFVNGLSDTGAEHMEAIKADGHFGEGYVLLSPGNRPRRVYYKDVSGTDTLSTRFVGMQPVTKFQVERVAGSWSSVLGAGTYYVVVTEVFNPGQPDEIEGTFSGDPLYVTIDAITTQCIRVHRNADDSTTKVNDGTNGTNTATHWRIYLAPGQANILPVPSLNSFRRVATIDIANVTADLKDSNPTTAYASANAQDSSGYSLTYDKPAGLISSSAATSTATTSGTTGAYTVTTASSVANVKVGMPVYGTNVAAGARVTQVTAGSPNTITLDKQNVGTVSGTVNYGPGASIDGSYATTPDQTGVMGVRLSNFGFINSNQFSGKTVYGVTVRLYYKWDNTEGSDNAGEDRGFNVFMKIGGVTTSSKFNIGNRSGQGSSNTFGGNRFGFIEAGGNGDTWGRTWNSGLTDFLDGTIFLHVERAASSQYQKHFIDGVELKVWFSGVDVNFDGEPFRTITYTTQVNEQIAIGADGPPPNCDTGDIIDGQLVVNDLSQDGLIWASLPDEYEGFPALYKANVTSRRWDQVMVIRRVGATGVLFCKNTIKRLNYFPTEVDSDATRGRAWENITNDHGVASKRGVALFDMPGRGILAAYIAHNGLWLTDGITSWPANEDLDWPATVNVGQLSNAVLVSYPRLYLLAMYYAPAGATYNTRVMYFAYHPSHLKSGNRLAAIGPVQCRAKSACRTDLSGTTQLLTGNQSDGKVYLEDSGNTSADALVTIAPNIKTRLIYPVDVGGQARVERLWLRVKAHGTSITGVFTLNIYRQNIGENLTLAETKSLTTDATTLTDDKLLVIHPDNLGEAFQLNITKADLDAAYRLSYLSVLGNGYGLEKNLA